MDTLLSMFLKKETAPNLIRFDNETKTISHGEEAGEEDTTDMAEELETHVDGQEEKVDRGRLLCMDGGGIRGLVLVQMLLEIENIGKVPIHHLFDWIAGTSTGGILALAIGAGKTMKQCMCLYLRMKEQAFVGSRPYPSENLENLLKDTFGPQSVMTDILHPKLMITGVMADRKPVDLHFFRNYVSASDILGIVTPERMYTSCYLKNPALRIIIYFIFSSSKNRKSPITSGSTEGSINLESSPSNWSCTILFSCIRTFS